MESNDELFGWSKKIRDRADSNGVCLCLVNELPPWHFQHRGIKHGYRYCASKSSVIMSLFYWHNESINVWSHIIASFAIFVFFLQRWPEISARTTDSSFDQSLLIFSVLFGNVFPLLCSAGCHSFYCIDKTTHKACWFIDFLGIISGMLICGFGFLYFSFYCRRSFVMYWGAVLGLLCAVLVWWCWVRFSRRLDKPMLHPRDRFPEFSFSLSFFISFASFIPIVLAWYLQHEHYSVTDLYWLLVEATLCPLLLSIGVVVFAQGGFPERFLTPHVCDMLGHSHQIWHLITAIVMFSLCNNTVKYYLARAEHGCGTQ